MDIEEQKRRQSRYHELLVAGNKPKDAYRKAFGELKASIETFEHDIDTAYYRISMDRNENRR